MLAIGGAHRLHADDPAAADLFEKQVRPVLVERCHECHGAQKQEANLRLDSAQGQITGGDNGPAIVRGKPDESQLVERILQPDPELRMPPVKAGPQLTDVQIRAISRWIELGVPWPDSAPSPPATTGDSTRRHWAFQPVERPAVPDVVHEDWAKNPIDRFVLGQLESAGLFPAPAADRRTLIRRATYDLTGLPPTYEDVAAFVGDDSSDAYERLIDRLLDSADYGEQWGRYWLDIARYSDSKGYVYSREERFYVHSWLYRDWVVQSLNDNLPYNRFLLLQLAADQVVPNDPAVLAALGYLTVGCRFLGVTQDIIDDRIDVVCRGLMGLTVGCARCHDHKYDPIPTADYYSLYGVFQNCTAVPGVTAAPPGRTTAVEGVGG